MAVVLLILGGVLLVAGGFLIHPGVGIGVLGGLLLAAGLDLADGPSS